MTQHEALCWCLVYFANLDRSNAAMHCAPVRYSPITFRIVTALNEDWPEGEDITEDMAMVLDHLGLYEEDRGR